MLVSFGVATDVASFDGDYDLWVVEPQTGARTKLLGEPGVAEVDAAPLYGRAFRGVFASALDEPNGHVVRRDDRREAEVHVLDARVLASLLFQNTPTGRAIDPDLRTFDLLEELPPPLEVQSFAQAGASAVTDAFGQVFVRRRLLGAVPIQDDGSAKFRIPGGVPFLFRLPDTPRSRAGALPRIQREAMAFAPGEDAPRFRASGRRPSAATATARSAARAATPPSGPTPSAARRRRRRATSPPPTSCARPPRARPSRDARTAPASHKLYRGGPRGRARIPMVRALLVDDDRKLGSPRLGELFQAHDVTLEHAADGLSGLARATTEPFDVVRCSTSCSPASTASRSAAPSANGAPCPSSC